MKYFNQIMYVLGSWLILNGLGLEFNLLYPIGLMLVLTGLDMKRNRQ